MGLLLALQSIAFSGTVLVTGGGVVAVTGQEGAIGQVAVTGGGTATVSGQEGAARQVVVTGGGPVSESHFTERFGSPLVSGGGAAQVTGEAQVTGIFVHGGGSVTAEGFRTGGALDTGGIFGRAYDHRARYVEQRKGKVRVSGNGDLCVIGEKGAFGEIEISGGGGVDVEGDKRYPAQYQALLITALAA